MGFTIIYFPKGVRRGEWETISPTSGGFVADGSKLDNACENVAKEELNVLILKA